MLTSVPTLFPADVLLKKCALIALHLIAEERRDGDGCHAPGLVDEWMMGCPKSPMWESDGEAWSGVQMYGSPSNETETLSFNKFVFILAMRLEVASKFGFLAILNLD